jgi:peroxiredoxin
MPTSSPAATSHAPFTTPAPTFSLPATDGRSYTLDDIAGRNGTVIVFICNHCPYVKAVIDRLVADAKVLQAEGIGVAAICCNDARTHPDDSFPKMKEFARLHGFPFPYLHDESQAVARGHGAGCTPAILGVGGGRQRKYSGGGGEGGRATPAPGAKRELVEAMRAIAAGREPGEQTPSIGCSIKWKAA